MATIKKCDRCGKARKGKYFYLSLSVAEQADAGDLPNEEDETEWCRTAIQDCCESCRKTIEKCVGLKKKPRKAKPRGNAKPRGKADAQEQSSGQSELPTPNGAPAKPSVPPPPEG